MKMRDLAVHSGKRGQPPGRGDRDHNNSLTYSLALQLIEYKHLSLIQNFSASVINHHHLHVEDNSMIVKLSIAK
jgi:hypothetical protein